MTYPHYFIEKSHNLNYSSHTVMLFCIIPNEGRVCKIIRYYWLASTCFIDLTALEDKIHLHRKSFPISKPEHIQTHIEKGLHCWDCYQPSSTFLCLTVNMLWDFWNDFNYSLIIRSSNSHCLTRLGFLELFIYFCNQGCACQMVE